MTRLPAIRPRKFVSALKRAGFQESHQRGSHLHLAHPDGREVVVPMHAKDLKRGTLIGLLKQAGLNQDELRSLL